MPPITAPNPFGSRAAIASDPENIERDSVFYDGFRWVRILDPSTDRFGQITVQRAWVPFTDQMSKTRAQDCIRNYHTDPAATS